MILRSNNKLLALYAILTIILCSGHAFQTILPTVLCMVYPLAALVVLFELPNIKNMQMNRMRCALWIFILMILCTLFVNLGSGVTFYVQLLCVIVAAYGISRWYSFEDTKECYLKIMTFVTIVAVVGYVLVQTTSIVEMLPTMENINQVEYGVAGIFNVIIMTPERNCGMFWEPGMFATHLTIAMVLEILAKKKANIWRIILFSLGIFTANSSAGFALWFFCLMLLIVKKANMRNFGYSAIALIALIAGVVVVLNFDNILQQTGLADNEYFAKLATDSVKESSRMKALEHNLKSFLSEPFFGVGIVTATAQMDYVADTSTSTYLMSVFGILGIAYTIYWIVGIFKIPKLNTMAKVLLLVIVMVIVNKEPHHQILFTWCLLFYVIKGEFAPKKQRKEEEKADSTDKRRLV